MNKIAIRLFLFAAMLAIISCEGGTTFTKDIANQSDEVISIQLFTEYGPTSEFEIKPGESRQIFWRDQLGNFVDESYTCTQIIDSVHLVISSNKTLLKDIMDDNNWERKSKDGRNAKEACTFTITCSDLE